MMRPSVPCVLRLLVLSLVLLVPGARAQETEAPPAGGVQATEKPFLWRIETAPPCWLYGTIHVGDPRVTTLPDSVDRAIDEAAALYCELALDPKTVMQMTLASLLPRGTKLVDVVGEELNAQVERLASELGLGKRTFRRMKPWVVATGLPMMKEELRNAQRGRKALDIQIYERAKKAGKRVGGLERLSDQLGIFEGMDVDEQKAFLKSSLDSLEKTMAEGKSPISDLIDLYVAGDLDAIAKEMTSWSGEMPEKLGNDLMTKLLDVRNERMAHEVVRLIQEHPTESQFFAVGAAHMIGDAGVVKLLERRGYTLTRVAAKVDAESLEARKKALQARKARLREEIERLDAELVGR